MKIVCWKKHIMECHALFSFISLAVKAHILPFTSDFLHTLTIRQNLCVPVCLVFVFILNFAIVIEVE